MKKLTYGICLILMLTIFVGCGSKSSSESDFGSVNNGSSGGTDTNGDALASCSTSIQAYNTSSGSRVPVNDVKVVAQVFQDQFGATRKDLIRLKFQAAPNALWISENYDMQFYRWIASPNNTASIDPSYLGFQFEKKFGGGAKLMSNNVYSIFNWDEMVQFADFVNQQIDPATSLPRWGAVSDASPTAFFNEMVVVVDTKDTTDSYQVLRVVLRTSGGQSVREVDVLIPRFKADPSLYNADARHPQMLKDLHPLKGQSGYSQSQFQSLANASCFLPLR